MRKDKIFELKIEEDDDLSGIDSISLVDEPAIEVNWVAFNKEKPHEFHIPEGQDKTYLGYLESVGESEEELFNQGWEVFSTKIGDRTEFIDATPNASSELDTEKYLIRYKYILNPQAPGAPIKETTREFCRDLINKNYVFRVEDLFEIRNDTNTKYGSNSAIDWRGGFNCRHLWQQITYHRGTDISIKASDRTGRVQGEESLDVLGFPQEDTRVPEWPSFSKQSFIKISVDYDDTLSTDRGKNMVKQLLRMGNDVHIVTRRRSSDSTAVYRTALQLGIPKDKVHFTEGKLKWETIKRLGIRKHIDNNQNELDAIKTHVPGVLTEKFKHEDFALPYFEKKEDAEKYAEKIGCKGSHEHIMDGRTFYMPCEEHPEDMGYDVGGIGGYVDPGIKKKKRKKLEEDFEYLFQKSYSDYPDSVKNNAKAVLKWVEENGWGSCGTDVGKQRANQLAKGEPISEETIKRMYSYLSRHEKDLESSKGYGDGCGKLMYDSWGGKTALRWAESKIKSIEREKMSKQYFQIDSEEKRVVLGPAMIPNMRIYRKDALGNPYYVFFSPETIKMIAEKYMRNKYLDNNDQMHDGQAVSDVYVIESWIKEDEHDKSVKYGFGELPIGTWFVSMKVRNPEIWDKVKNKELNGFSVSGFFEEVQAFTKEEMFLYQVAEILKKY